MAGLLSACSTVPGTSASTMRQQSAVELPVKQDDQLVPANVTVKPITAELIIDQIKAQQPGFRSGAAGGQTATEAPTKAPDFGLGHQDYRLGPGDIINVTVWDHPELTIPAGSYRSAESSGTLVTEDGTIFYPYVGILNVNGMRVSELRDILAQRLARHRARSARRSRRRLRSKRIYVVGEVKSPGLQTIDDIRMTILEAINRAGAFGGIRSRQRAADPRRPDLPCRRAGPLRRWRHEPERHPQGRRHRQCARPAVQQDSCSARSANPARRS